MKRIFISDLHLSIEREPLTEAFSRFLASHCQDIDELYILGDLFDVWLGDDDDSPFTRQITALLAALPCQLNLMHGNRDFLIGQDFCKAAKAQLLDDPTSIMLGSREALLTHGDSLCTLDTDYMKARAVLRSAAFQTDFLGKPLEERATVAAEMRGASKAHTRETAADIMDVTPAEVVKLMQETGVKLLVHGHTHRPAVHQVDLDGGEGRRYVLGDWHTSMKYLSEEDGDLQLHHWDLRRA